MKDTIIFLIQLKPILDLKTRGRLKVVAKLIKCKCGCGGKLLDRDKWGKKREYIYGLLACNKVEWCPNVVGGGGIPLLNIPIGNQTK